MKTYNDFIQQLEPKPAKPKTRLDLVYEKFNELKEAIQFDSSYDDIVFICLAYDLDARGGDKELYFYYNGKINHIAVLRNNMNFLMDVVCDINVKAQARNGNRIVIDYCDITIMADINMFKMLEYDNYDEFKQQLQKILVTYYEKYCEEMKEIVNENIEFEGYKFHNKQIEDISPILFNYNKKYSFIVEKTSGNHRMFEYPTETEAISKRVEFDRLWAGTDKCKEYFYFMQKILRCFDENDQMVNADPADIFSDEELTHYIGLGLLEESMPELSKDCTVVPNFHNIYEYFARDIDVPSKNKELV